jgi:methylated-DNA-[protein]-cysteine S-methyltransferase
VWVKLPNVCNSDLSSEAMHQFQSLYDSPVGQLTLLANAADALTAVLWENDDPDRVKVPSSLIDQETTILSETKRQLDAYFAEKRQTFDLRLEFYGTDFQIQVWQQLLRIPFGETRTYGQLAQFLNDPKASRAVGAANGKNPLSIVVPCHRVIGSSGKLTGFAGGLEAKLFLLTLEKNILL